MRFSNVTLKLKIKKIETTRNMTVMQELESDKNHNKEIIV